MDAMDDLEKAILIANEPAYAAADPSLRAQAMDICDRAKSVEPSALLRLCLDRLHRSSHLPVRFWCLQSIHGVILLCYGSLPSSDLPVLRSSLLSLAASATDAAVPPFLKNKLAQAIGALVRIEYPSLWPDPFLCLLPGLPAADPATVDMFARFLLALDDDLLSLDYPRSPQDAAAAARVKDAMRVQCVPQIARHWFDAASLYRSSDPSLAAVALDTMRRYVPWIDIGLVANEAFVPLLFDIVVSPASAEQLRAAASGCILAVASKRMMDPHQKFALLRSLPVGRVLGDAELVLRVPSLITGYATEALECYKRLGSGNADGYSALRLLEEALPSVFIVMQESDKVDTSNVVEFFSDYVTTLKSPSQEQSMYLSQILEVIRVQISYDPSYRSNLDIPDKIGREEEEQMREHRKDLMNLFRSVCRVAPNVAQLFIRDLLVGSLSSAEASVEDVEAMLTLVYRLADNVSEEAIRTGSGLLSELIPILLSAQFSCHSHRVVALVYLETITKYMKFVQENSQYIPHALSAFLDQRGVHHPNVNVSRRASYLFMRAVKLLKAKFVVYLDRILQSLQDTVAQFANVDWSSKDLKGSDVEDGSHTFEAIGLLIGMEEVTPEKQSENLAALLQPLCQQLEKLRMDAKANVSEESSSEVLILQQIITALHALSKGFNEKLATSSRPAIGIMFKQTLDIVIQLLVFFPRTKPLRKKIISFIHRMIEILGASIFPCLPVALRQLLVDIEPKDMLDFLLLINQLICKFGKSVEGILEEVFPAIASSLSAILSRDVFPVGPGSNAEELRELQELQRVFYTFLHVMANHDLSSVFLAPNCKNYLDAIMQLLLLTACCHKDIFVRKLCVQIFIKLIKDWCTSYSSQDKVPGFRSFMIQKFATDCCLYSVLDKSFEFRDANTLGLFGEIIVAQMIMYEKFGSDFVNHFMSKGLTPAHCPQDLAEQYYQKLQVNDMKTLKSFYQLLIENLRQQQNGSLVFR